MNKIIIMGHPDSGYRSVEALLLRCGMREALPAPREGLLPRDIHRTLRKAHQIPAAHTITDERGFLSVPIGPVWHGMALDLLLGNLHQEPWGWADPDTIFFLDYWRTLDPESIFVLVYDSPASVLREGSFDPSVNDGEVTIRALLDNWAAYNSAMLRYHFQHPERCLLVHSRQLHGNARYGVQEIQGRLSAPLPDPDASAEAPGQIQPFSPASLLDDPGQTISTHQSENATARFLAEFQLDRFPQYRDLYDELQAAANLPLEEEVNIETYSAEALIHWLRERRAILHSMRQMNARYHEAEANLHVLKQNHELECLKCAQACEELEQTSLENRSLRLQMQQWQRPKGAPERVRKQLSYRLGSLMVILAKNPIGILVLPFSLIGESLRFRTERREARQKLPPLHEYVDFDQAQEVKKSLRYRLGNTLVRRCKSPLGWIILPFAMIRQVQASLRSPRSDA